MGDPLKTNHKRLVTCDNAQKGFPTCRIQICHQICSLTTPAIQALCKEPQINEINIHCSDPMFFFSIRVHNSLYHNVGFIVWGFDHCDLDPTFQMHMSGIESYNEHDNVLPIDTSGPDWSKDNKQLIWNTCITTYYSLIWLETVLNFVTIEGDSNTAFKTFIFVEHLRYWGYAWKYKNKNLYSIDKSNIDTTLFSRMIA